MLRKLLTSLIAFLFKLKQKTKLRRPSVWEINNYETKTTRRKTN